MDYSVPAPIPQGLLPMVPVTGGKVPKRRVKDASEAQTIVANLWRASLQRNAMWASIQGQIDGNPPYDPARLRNVGRASDPNVNTLEAKAIRSSALVPYYDLFAGGQRYVEVRLAPPGMGDDEKGSYDASASGSARYNGVDVTSTPNDPSYDAVRLSEDSGIVSEEYDRLLRRWTNFENVMWTGLTDYVTFGRMHLPWESIDSWRFRRIPFHRVMVPDGTPIDLDEMEAVIVLQNYTVARLYGMIRDEESARSIGWNIDETMNALSRAVPVDPTIPNDPVAVQQMIRDSDIYVSARSSTVQTATLLVKEMSGKWSESIIRRDQIPGSINATDDASQNASTRPPAYLFDAPERYDSLSDALPSLFFEVSDGTFNSSSGLGRDIYSLMQLKDRIFCTQAHSVMLRNSLVLQPRQALDKSRLNLLQVGAVTWLPEQAEVVQSSILGDIASTIAVTQEMDKMVERNTGIYRPTLQQEKGNPDTLGEFQMKFAQATVLSTSAINRFYAQMDRLYAVQWKRVLKAGLRKSGSSIWEKEARRFVERCEARGVSRDALKRLDYIRAFRAIGQGSQAMRQQTLQQLMSLYQLLPANGQENLLEDVIRTSASQHSVERYLPDADRRKLPSDQLAYALLENAALRAGAPVSWTPSQNNVIHAQAHLQAGAQAAAAVQQGADPHDISAFLDAIGAHTAVHLKRLSLDPMAKDAFKVLEGQWKQLASISDKLKAAIMALPRQQQALAQKQGEVLTDAKVKMLDVQLKNQTSQAKAAATLQLKAQRQQAELALKARQQEAQAALDAQALQADTAFKQQAALTDATLSDAETAASIQREVARTASELALRRAEHAHTLALEREAAAHERAMKEQEVASAGAGASSTEGSGS
jgi:hypothetical protein